MTVPGSNDTARPWLPELLLIAASLESEDNQVTSAVRSCELPSEKLPKRKKLKCLTEKDRCVWGGKR